MSEATPTEATNTAETELDIKEQDLRIQELQLKVDALKKPEYRKISTWTGVIAIAAALTGIVFQGILYQVKSENAKKDLAEITQKKEALKRSTDSLRASLKPTQDSIQSAQVELHTLEARNVLWHHFADSVQHVFDSLNSIASRNPGHPVNKLISQGHQLVNDMKQSVTAQIESIPKAKVYDSSAAAANASAAQSSPSSHPPVVPDDPQKNQWGGQPEQNDRRLSAEVREIGYHTYKIVLTVMSTNPNKPLTDSVRFHLHNTFRDSNPLVPVVDGKAVLTLIAVGSFTVGAEADHGKTRLEYDLVNAPNVSDYFKTH